MWAYPVEEAAGFLQRQLGKDVKWQNINQAIWGYFRANHGGRLGLSGARQIAARLEVGVNDVVSAMSMLTGPDNGFLQQVYYQDANFGQSDEALWAEIVHQTRRWLVEKSIEESEWRRWAASVFVGWEPGVIVSPTDALNGGER